MAHRFQWLGKLRADELKAVSVAIGVNTGGTKPILQERILQRLNSSIWGPEKDYGVVKDSKLKSAVSHATRQVVSIDMGIKNLAFCLLTVPTSTSTTAIPVVREWRRINVASADENTSQALPESDLGASNLKEPFEPATLAEHACNLTRKVLAMRPNHILIERQRFRSMGGNAVLEWTLRVNMFESMLYASLATLKQQGNWSGQVWGISPAKVAKFWIREDDEVKLEDKASTSSKAGRTSKSAKGKKAKINLVTQWLRQADNFQLEQHARTTSDAYLRKMKGTRGGDTSGKLDDLADCLLQGMAWYRWEMNRQMLCKRGMAAMAEIESAQA